MTTGVKSCFDALPDGLETDLNVLLICLQVLGILYLPENSLLALQDLSVNRAFLWQLLQIFDLIIEAVEATDYLFFEALQLAEYLPDLTL